MLFSGKPCMNLPGDVSTLNCFFHNLVSVFGIPIEVLALSGVDVRELRLTSKHIDHQPLVAFDAFAGNFYSVYSVDKTVFGCF